jgi:hypothetical protein
VAVPCGDGAFNVTARGLSLSGGVGSRQAAVAPSAFWEWCHGVTGWRRFLSPVGYRYW